MDLAFQDIKHDILHTRDPFQNGHPFISFWPQLENRHVKDNFGTSTLSGEKDVSHTNHTIERNHHKFVVFRFFFPTELLMKLSDWVRKWPFDHPNGGHLTLNPWKGSLKTSKKPNKIWGFSMEKTFPYLHPTTIPKNASPSCTALTTPGSFARCSDGSFQLGDLLQRMVSTTPLGVFRRGDTKR